MTSYVVEIVQRSDGWVVRKMEARNQRDALQIERGANINMNHDSYFTRIVTEEETA